MKSNFFFFFFLTVTVLLCSDVTNDGETGTYFCALRFSFFFFVTAYKRQNLFT